MIQRTVLLVILFFPFLLVQSQIPAGYYDSAIGLTGTALRNKLHDIISAGYSEQSYSSLWTHMQTTDAKPNGKVWDMYSDNPTGTPAYEFTFGADQCGSYNSEGDCYNREHSFPASWFSDGAPMYTDLFHLVPTDGWVNNKRGNFAFGRVGSATWTSTNGSKVGSSNYPGYNNTVFEPIDAYKGDFARSYFYMATRYKDEMPGWTSDMISGGDLSVWAKNLLIEWSNLDTISTKEIDRNNAVYGIQNNRNPYIDHPEYIDSIWGNTSSTEHISFTFLNYEVYPNPASDEVYISIYSSKTTDFSLLIFNYLGEIVYTESFHVKQYSLPLNNLSNGSYIIRVSDKNGISHTKRLTIIR